MKAIYWTVWGQNWSMGQVCSEHKTLKAARREASLCESQGGARHNIYKVTQMKFEPKPKRKKR